MAQKSRSIGTQAGAHPIRPIPITAIEVDPRCVKAPDGLDTSLIGDRPVAGKNFWRVTYFSEREIQEWIANKLAARGREIQA
jgi:hypothetical protein